MEYSVRVHPNTVREGYCDPLASQTPRFEGVLQMGPAGVSCSDCGQMIAVADLHGHWFPGFLIGEQGEFYGACLCTTTPASP